MIIPYDARTERGQHREQNQDYILLEPSLGFFSVADGMGGYDSEGYCPYLVTQLFYSKIKKYLPLNDLGTLLKVANNTIQQAYEVARKHPTISKMGTTLSAIMINTDIQRAYIVHIGDSRIYQLRDRTDFRQLTEDHTFGNQLVRSGVLTHEQAALATDGHRLTRCVGNNPDTIPDVFEVLIEKGDQFALTTDGFHDQMEPDQIRKLMLDNVDSYTMVDLAFNQGSRDNTTVVRFDI